MFKALADPTRRSLLDELFREDGQTLSALEQRLPMTRFGVMKHLKVLEDAGLVTTRRRGREKLHFLNPVPIRLVHDRWVSKYSEPWAAGLSELKTKQHEEDTDTSTTTDTEAEEWEATLDGSDRRRRCSRSSSKRLPSVCGRRSPIRSCGGKYNFGASARLRLDARLPL